MKPKKANLTVPNKHFPTGTLLILFILLGFFAACNQPEQETKHTKQLKSAEGGIAAFSGIPSMHKMRFGFNFGFLNDYNTSSGSPFQSAISTVKTDFGIVRLRTNGVLRKGYNPSSNDIFDDSLIVNRINHIVAIDSHYLLVSIVSLPYKIPNGDFDCDYIDTIIDFKTPCTIKSYLTPALGDKCDINDINENRFYPNVFNTQFNVDTFQNWMIEFCEELNDSGILHSQNNVHFELGNEPDAPAFFWGSAGQFDSMTNTLLHAIYDSTDYASNILFGGFTTALMSDCNSPLNNRT